MWFYVVKHPLEGIMYKPREDPVEDILREYSSESFIAYTLDRKVIEALEDFQKKDPGTFADLGGPELLFELKKRFAQSDEDWIEYAE